MPTNIRIKNKFIGEGYPTLIVAELSANHRHRFDLAVKTIKAMKEAGADAVKLQSYTPDTITLNCDNKYFRIKRRTIWDGSTLYSLYREAYTPWDWLPKLKKTAEDLGLICFSSPFDESAVDFLEQMKVPAYKIASFEITDIPLIEYVASKNKPIIISTGVATLNDIKQATSACRRKGNKQIILLKCTSAYPTPIEDFNLLTMPNMKKKFKTIVGLSDHSLNTVIPAAAVSLGAKVIEKHFILSRNIGGPDAPFSLEPHEFKEMVTAVRETEKALGKVTYRLTGKMKKAREFCPSLFAVKDINKEELFTKDNVRSIRPGHGLYPKYINKVLGRKAKKVITKGTPIRWNLID
jgi:pseudaminic acid synthase